MNKIKLHTGPKSKPITIWLDVDGLNWQESECPQHVTVTRENYGRFRPINVLPSEPRREAYTGGKGPLHRTLSNGERVVVSADEAFQIDHQAWEKTVVEKLTDEQKAQDRHVNAYFHHATVWYGMRWSGSAEAPMDSAINVHETSEQIHYLCFQAGCATREYERSGVSDMRTKAIDALSQISLLEGDTTSSNTMKINTAVRIAREALKEIRG